MSKIQYKPERQPLGKGLIFVHGKNQRGQHVDCIMKDPSKFSDTEVIEQYGDQFKHGLIFLRSANNDEKIQYCQ